MEITYRALVAVTNEVKTLEGLLYFRNHMGFRNLLFNMATRLGGSGPIMYRFGHEDKFPTAGVHRHFPTTRQESLLCSYLDTWCISYMEKLHAAGLFTHGSHDESF